MKARDYRGNHRVVLRIAEAAQRAAIGRALVDNYTTGKRLGRWDDFRFSLCMFNARDVIAATKTIQGEHPADWRNWSTTSTPRKYLNELAEGGFLEVRRWSGTVRFRFSRAKCDAIAAQVYAELLADGIPPKTENSR